MEKRIAPRTFEIVFSIIALIIILWLVDVGKLLGIILEADVFLVLGAMFFYSITLFLMSYRIRMILKEMGEKIPLKESFLANAAGLLASDFTPGRSGYFVTPVILNSNCSTPIDKGMVTIVSPQIVEFFLKAVGAALAIGIVAYSLPEVSENAVFLGLGIGLMLSFCAAMSIALFVPQFITFIRKFSFIPGISWGCDFLSAMQNYRKPVLKLSVPIIAISVIVFFLKGIEWWFFGMALGIEFSIPFHPFLIFLVLQPLISVFQFAPFPTAAGIGLSEGSAVASMALLGVQPELAVAYVFLTRGGPFLIHLSGLGRLVPALSSGIAKSVEFGGRKNE